MSANYIYNETLWGATDGINVTFTTLNNIQNIEEVYLWGAAYRDISFVEWTNVITFVDAPPNGADSPTCDYFSDVTVVSSPTTDVTFGDVIDDTFEKIGALRTSNVYLEDQIKRQINKWFKRIKNIKAYKDQILQYSFKKAEDSYAIGYAATTITVTAWTGVPSTGAIILWDASYVTYSSYVAWVMGANAWYVYNNWDRVSFWYKLPTWVKRPAEIIMDRQVLKYVDNREFISTWGSYTYTIIQDASWEIFLFLPFRAKEATVTVKYTPEYDVLELDADIVNIMYEYSDVLSLYAAYNVLLLREDDRWQAIKQEYIELKKDMQSYLSRAVDWINNKFRSTPLVRGAQTLLRSTFK